MSSTFDLSRVRAGVEFLRSPRVRGAPEAERLAFLEQRAGLTRDEALEALRLVDAADNGREPSSLLWWGALAAAGAAFGGGAALLSRELPRWEVQASAPAAARLSLPADAAQAGSGRAGVDASKHISTDALDSIRQLLAEQEARHERSVQQLREQVSMLIDGQRAATTAVERLSARLDAVLAASAERRETGAVPSSKAHGPVAPAAATADSGKSAREAAQPIDVTTPRPRDSSAALRSAHAELRAADPPGTALAFPASASAPTANGKQARFSELESPAMPSPLPPRAPPPTPASVLPATPRLSYAQLVEHVQQGKPAPGYREVDDSPIGALGSDAASPGTGEAPARQARPKPWERAAVLGSASALTQDAGLLTEGTGLSEGMSGVIGGGGMGRLSERSGDTGSFGATSLAEHLFQEEVVTVPSAGSVLGAAWGAEDWAEPRPEGKDATHSPAPYVPYMHARAGGAPAGEQDVAGSTQWPAQRSRVATPATTIRPAPSGAGRVSPPARIDEAGPSTS